MTKVADESFEARAKRMQALARARGDVTPEPVNKGQVIQFPLWPELQRAAPNDFLRSALFAVVKKGERKWFDGIELPCWPGASIRYKGQQLDQFDESVWLQVVHLHQEQGVAPGRPLRIYVRAFLRALGVGYGENARKALYRSLERMRANAITYTRENGGRYIGGLLVAAAEDPNHEHWNVIVDPAMASLFAPGHYTRADWQTRLALPTDLARWLHGYVSSHQATSRHPHRIGLERLRELCGATTALKDFRWKLKRAMAELEQVGAVLSWRLTDRDALEFVRARQRMLPEKT